MFIFIVIIIVFLFVSISNILSYTQNEKGRGDKEVRTMTLEIISGGSRQSLFILFVCSKGKVFSLHIVQKIIFIALIRYYM